MSRSRQGPNAVPKAQAWQSFGYAGMVNSRVNCAACNKASNSEIESYRVAPSASFANAVAPLYVVVMSGS
jgi:hypothetical protein